MRASERRCELAVACGSVFFNVQDNSTSLKRCRLTPTGPPPPRPKRRPVPHSRSVSSLRVCAHLYTPGSHCLWSLCGRISLSPRLMRLRPQEIVSGSLHAAPVRPRRASLSLTHTRITHAHTSHTSLHCSSLSLSSIRYPSASLRRLLTSTLRCSAAARPARPSRHHSPSSTGSWAPSQ